MGAGSQLISVHPDELRFQFELEKQSCCDLKIVNNTEHHVAFKSTIIPPNTDVDEISQDAFNKDGERTIEECKLIVVYTYPGHENSEDEASFTKGAKQSPDAESDPTVRHLKEEKHAVLQQMKLLQHELERLRRLSRWKSDPGFSLSFVLLVGFIGAMVGFIFKPCVFCSTYRII